MTSGITWPDDSIPILGQFPLEITLKFTMLVKLIRIQKVQNIIAFVSNT